MMIISNLKLLKRNDAYKILADSLSFMNMQWKDYYYSYQAKISISEQTSHVTWSNAMTQYCKEN